MRLKKEAFLAAYAETGMISRAAQASGVVRMSHYHWLETDKSYPARFAKAAHVAKETLEDEAVRRARHGLRKLKFHKGLPIIDPETQQPYFEHEFSDLLLIFLLKALDPKKYRENIDLTTGGETIKFGKITFDGDKEISSAPRAEASPALP